MTDRPPDFALLRAVDILERIAKDRVQPNEPPPPVEHPVVLASDRCTLALGKTRRHEIERAFGRGVEYPAKGFRSYGVAPWEPQPEGAPRRWLLSVFYRGDVLFGVEHYIPKVRGIPPMALTTPGVLRIEPGGFKLTGPLHSLDYFKPAHGGPSPVVFALAFEARFTGGVAWLMGNAGRIERIAIYGAE